MSENKGLIANQFAEMHGLMDSMKDELHDFEEKLGPILTPNNKVEKLGSNCLDENPNDSPMLKDAKVIIGKMQSNFNRIHNMLTQIEL